MSLRGRSSSQPITAQCSRLLLLSMSRRKCSTATSWVEPELMVEKGTLGRMSQVASSDSPDQENTRKMVKLQKNPRDLLASNVNLDWNMQNFKGVAIEHPHFVTGNSARPLIWARWRALMEAVVFVYCSLSCITWKLFIFSLSTYEYLSKHGNSAAQHLGLQALGWPS